MVLLSGFTTGLLFVEVNPAGLLFQLYVFPVVDVSPIRILSPKHNHALPPVEAFGTGLVLICAESLLEHPLYVSVR